MGGVTIRLKRNNLSRRKTKQLLFELYEIEISLGIKVDFIGSAIVDRLAVAAKALEY